MRRGNRLSVSSDTDTEMSVGHTRAISTTVNSPQETDRTPMSTRRKPSTSPNSTEIAHTQSQQEECSTPPKSAKKVIHQQLSALPKMPPWAKDIKAIGEPLQSAIRESPLMEHIPNTWLKVTLGPYYTYKDRTFAKQALQADPNLIDNFLLAD